jgi:hypothetical protein
MKRRVAHSSRRQKYGKIVFQNFFSFECRSSKGRSEEFAQNVCGQIAGKLHLGRKVMTDDNTHFSEMKKRFQKLSMRQVFYKMSPKGGTWYPGVIFDI